MQGREGMPPVLPSTRVREVPGVPPALRVFSTKAAVTRTRQSDAQKAVTAGSALCTSLKGHAQRPSPRHMEGRPLLPGVMQGL